MVKSKVKYIQSLSQKKQRDDHGVFVAEGPKIINELLGSDLVQVREIFAVKEWADEHHDSLAKHNASIDVIDEQMLSRISFLSTPNKVLGIFSKNIVPNLELAGKITLMTDNIQDPGNMGSIVRCADWFGISQVICSPECADVYGPKTVQSSMGSIGRVKVMYGDLAMVLTGHKNIGVYAATLDGESLFSFSSIKEGIIIIGNESKGISPEILSLPINRITIPRIGFAESLNAAVATGIILSRLAGS